MVKTKIDQFSWSYKLNKDKVPVVVRKAFYRPKTPLQVYYKLPDEEEWNLGFMVYVEARLYFGRSQSDMQADHLSFQEFVSIYDTEAELVDCSHPYIKFTRRYEYASLKVTTGFTPLEELNSFGSPHISASLEFLFFSLVFASTRVAPELTPGASHRPRRGPRIQRSGSPQFQPSPPQSRHREGHREA
jgi:hypothetical protein